MAVKHQEIARDMHDFLHRGVDVAEENIQNKLFNVQSKIEMANLIGYTNGYTPAKEINDFKQFAQPDLYDKKHYQQLNPIVERMPTLQVCFIPLVLEKRQASKSTTQSTKSMAIVMRVRCSATASTFVYIDMNNRKYDSFEKFLSSNRLPEGVLWYPRNGIIEYGGGIPSLPLLDCRVIERPTEKLKTLATVGSITATLLTFTPLAPVTGPILLCLTTAPLVGFAIADLIDGVHHEKGSVVASCTAALAFNLVTFASAGLTAASRVSKLRNALPASKLLMLDRTEKILKGGMRFATAAKTVEEIIGTVGGWSQLSNTEWVQLGALLCYAYRENFLLVTAKMLFERMQVDGLVKFFGGLCENVATGTLRKRIEGSQLDMWLKLVFDFLNNNESFKVDDKFVSIELHGYKLEFEKMFTLKWDALKELLFLLKDLTAHVGVLCADSKRAPWSQGTLNNVLEILMLLNKLPHVVYKPLSDYVQFGQNNHRFSISTVGQFLATPGLDRMKLLNGLSLMSSSKTERMNELRESGRIIGGDPALFRWFAEYTSVMDKCHDNNYRHAIECLLAVSDIKTVEDIVFKDDRIVVSPLLAITACEFGQMSSAAHETLFQDERFLQLCHDVDPQQMGRAGRVWMRSISTKYMPEQQLETVGLLTKVIDCLGINSQYLANMLQHALADSEATVVHVFFYLFFALKQQTEAPVMPSPLSIKKRFEELLVQACVLKMNNSTVVFARPYSQQDIIDTARKVLPFAQTITGDEPIPFGHPARAAYWLALMPSLGCKTDRVRIFKSLRYLLKSGTPTVLEKDENDRHAHRAKAVMFVNGKVKAIVEVLFPVNNNVIVQMSILFFGSAIENPHSFASKPDSEEPNLQ
ncbi:uncharacterized protein LOC128721548 [Anopheles nili]|uniref:uncharacterized protein LOC128721548 n=1 Tax=Anopheles nili TaxID=185578 RepID=UPI00237A9BC6|nr:uncharacterized protein LOC128721548 [Anopheles nili]